MNSDIRTVQLPTHLIKLLRDVILDYEIRVGSRDVYSYEGTMDDEFTRIDQIVQALNESLA